MFKTFIVSNVRETDNFEVKSFENISLQYFVKEIIQAKSIIKNNVF